MYFISRVKANLCKLVKEEHLLAGLLHIFTYRFSPSITRFIVGEAKRNRLPDETMIRDDWLFFSICYKQENLLRLINWDDGRIAVIQLWARELEFYSKEENKNKMFRRKGWFNDARYHQDKIDSYQQDDIARVVYNTYRGNQYSQWINYETPRYDQYNQNQDRSNRNDYSNQNRNDYSQEQYVKSDKYNTDDIIEVSSNHQLEYANYTKNNLEVWKHRSTGNVT